MRAKWIWYPGDFEIWLHREMSMRRDERRSLIPPFWRLDTHFSNVVFTRSFELEHEEEVSIFVEGRYNIWLDDGYVYGNPEKIKIGPGSHRISIAVVAEQICPAIWVQGDTLVSDEKWSVTNNNHREYQAASWKFERSDDRPSGFRLPTEVHRPVHVKQLAEEEAGKRGILLDFGRETFGYVRILDVQGTGKVSFYYGETREEALATGACETYDEAIVEGSNEGRSFTVPASRAFRYVQIVCEEGIGFERADMLYEYLPVEKQGRFRCSNDRLNQIWDVSEHTLHLTTREFFIDGIKRDRWVWSGDAYQSFLMNYYSFFELDVTRRTFIALRGKDPVETHINHILDYSFYWILGLQDYYQYTGDLSFVQDQYEKIRSLLQFCIARTNEQGFMDARPGDWIFVDWAEIDNKGEVAFEQVLFCRSLEIAASFAEHFGDHASASEWSTRAEKLKREIVEVFWDEELGGLVHSRLEGKLNRHMTKYANMFALLYGYMDEEKAETVRSRVMNNAIIQPIVTPYMQFYELASRCEAGDHETVLNDILQYWGGMLDLGATSFWERYDPDEQDAAHYAMYNRPFGKSLCHAWGASPLYLMGKYFLGVRPLTPGYESYLIQPELGGLEWLEGTVPMPNGRVEIAMDSDTIRIKSTAGNGTLRFRSTGTPSVNGVNINLTNSEERYFEVTIQSGVEYIVRY